MPQTEMDARQWQLANGVAEHDSARLSELTSELLQIPETGEKLITRAAFLLGDPALAEVRSSIVAPTGTFAVQESQLITGIGDRALSAGAKVAVSSQTDDTSTRLGFQIEDTGAILETRIRFLPSEVVRALIAPKLQPRMLGQGAQTFATLPLTATHIARYITLAHDPNPLHSDKAAAQAAGFADVIAPGMLLCALAEMAFAQTSPNTQIQDLRARFLSPALVNTAVQVIVLSASKTKSRLFVVSDAQDIHAIVDLFSAV